MNTELLTNVKQWLVTHRHRVVAGAVCAALLVSVSMNALRVVPQLMQALPAMNDSPVEVRQKPLALHEFPLLFGEAKAKPKPQLTEIPKSNLNLVLRGALAGDSDSTSSAIIQGSDGQDRFYQVGDPIPGGAILQSVHSTYVVINQGGHPQKLLLVASSPSSKPGLKPYASPPPSAVQGSSLPRGPVYQTSEIVEQAMEQLSQSFGGNSQGR